MATPARRAALLSSMLLACGGTSDFTRSHDTDPSAAPPRAGTPTPGQEPQAPDATPAPTAPVEPARAPEGPFPIVLVHGLFGNERIGPVDYWWHIPAVLRASGERVYVASNPPAHSIEARAASLAALVDEVLAETGAGKVNLVGHSMGGLDSRYLVSGLGYGDRVASVTTVGTPHHGSAVADVILGLLPGVSRDVVAGAFDLLTRIEDEAHREQDTEAAALALSTAGTAAFNAAHPDDPRVAYFSIVGETSMDPFFLVNGKDYCDLELQPTYLLLRALGERNDGLVSVRSQRWGEVLFEVEADHLNEVGQPLGVDGFAFDVEATYLSLAQELHARGF